MNNIPMTKEQINSWKSFNKVFALMNYDMSKMFRMYYTIVNNVDVLENYNMGAYPEVQDMLKKVMTLEQFKKDEEGAKWFIVDAMKEVARRTL